MRKFNKINISLLLAMISVISSANTSVEFWTTQTQSDRMKVIETLALTFEALNEGVDIKVVPVDENEMATQMAAASAAGTTPNVIEAGSSLLLAFGEEGIMDMNGNNQIINNVGKDRFFSGALDMIKSSNGSDYYGIPFHGWVQGIWYRNDWFKENNLAPPNSWKNILKAAEKLTDKQNNQYGILIGTKPEGYTEQVFTHLGMANGVREFNNEGELIFNSPETLETLKFYQELAEYNPPGPQTWRARDYYLQGKMAMFFYSTYIMDDLALADVAAGSLTSENFAELSDGQFDPDLVEKTSFAPIISNTEDASYGVLVGLSLLNSSSKSSNDVARRWVEFLYDPYVYISYLHMAPGGMNPMLKEIPNIPAYLDDPKGIFEVYGSDKIAEIIQGFESIKSFSVVDGTVYPQSGQISAKQTIPRMVYSVLFEGVSPEDALNKAESEMLETISK